MSSAAASGPGFDASEIASGGDGMYGADFSEIYDAIYASRGKDYEIETRELLKLLRERLPGANSLLDVACGTGNHLRFLRHHLRHAAGVDLSADMLAVAERNLPDVAVHQGDMRSFDLGTTYDAVICMFSSVGYVRTVTDLRRTLSRMATHLVPGGVLIVEPWYFPEQFIPGYVAADLVRSQSSAACRMSHSVRDGRNVDITVHYLVADSESGVGHATERHPMTLFSRAEYEDAFTAADCVAQFHTPELFPCGLFVGTRRH